MTPNVTDLKIITGWLNSLVNLTRTGSEPIGKDKIATYAVMLGRDFPSAAFTIDSLHHAAQGQEFFPAYDVARQRVSEWWRDHAPRHAPKALGGPCEGLQMADERWWSYWHAHIDEAEAADNAIGWKLEGMDQAQTKVAMLRSMVTRHSPAAAERIWGKAEIPTRATPEQIEYVRNLLHGVLA